MVTSDEVIRAVGEQPDLLAQAAAQLPADEAKKATAEILGNMSAKDAREVARGTLPVAPTGIWYLIIGGLFACVLVFGILAFLQLADDKNAEALIAIATTALGGIVGLLVTSPLAKA